MKFSTSNHNDQSPDFQNHNDSGPDIQNYNDQGPDIQNHNDVGPDIQGFAVTHKIHFSWVDGYSTAWDLYSIIMLCLHEKPTSIPRPFFVY